MAALTHYMGVAPVSDTSVAYRARTDSAAVIKARVSTASDLSGHTLSSGVSVVSGDDFTGGETIAGLTADTEYYLGIEVDGVLAHSSPYTRFRTPPATNYTGSIVVAWGSCQNATTASNMFPSILASGARLLNHQGDRGYPDDPTTAAQRTNYKTQYATDFQSDIVNRMLCLYTWDDHDYGGNNEDGAMANKTQARDVFKEFTPTPTLWDGTNHIGYDIRFGHVHFFVLDTRYQREESPGYRFPDVFPFLSDTANTGSGGTSLVLRTNTYTPSTFVNAYNGWYASITTGSGTFVRRITAYNGQAGGYVCTLDSSVPGLNSSSTFYLKNASMLDRDNLGATGQVTKLINGINNSTAVWKVICSSSPWNRTINNNDTWGGHDGAEWVEQRYIIEHITADNVLILSSERHSCGLDDGTNSIYPEGMAAPFKETAFAVTGTWSHGTYGGIGPAFGLATFTPTQATLSIRDLDGAAAITPDLVINASGVSAPPRILWLRA